MWPLNTQCELRRQYLEWGWCLSLVDSVLIVCLAFWTYNCLCTACQNETANNISFFILCMSCIKVTVVVRRNRQSFFFFGFVLLCFFSCPWLSWAPCVLWRKQNNNQTSLFTSYVKARYGMGQLTLPFYSEIH